MARAWRSIDDLDSEAAAAAGPRTKIDGDTQLSASFVNADGRLSFELSGDTRDAAISVELPPTEPDGEQRVSACARARVSPKAGTELQLWIWRGLSPVAAECVSVEFEATEMRIADGRRPIHASSWSPKWLSLEPPADAHARIGDLPAGREMDDAERGAEGRRVVVESAAGDDGGVAWRRLGPGRHRFLIREAFRVDLAALDREWLDGSAHGIALDASQLAGDERRELLLWAGWRQALLYLGGVDWRTILDVVGRRRSELRAPVALVDPALSRGKAGQPLPGEVVSLASCGDHLFVLLGSDSLELSRENDLASLADRLLLAGPVAEHALERDATENLRHLTERLQLTRLRQASGLSWSEVGRRAPLQ